MQQAPSGFLLPPHPTPTSTHLPGRSSLGPTRHFLALLPASLSLSLYHMGHTADVTNLSYLWSVSPYAA